jgi:hypothetical protein
VGLGLLTAPRNPLVNNTAQIIAGLLFLFVGPLIVRVYCELLILFFRMNETLTDIRTALAARDQNAPLKVDG